MNNIFIVMFVRIEVIIKVEEGFCCGDLYGVFGVLEMFNFFV